ncbi:hypothetical protein HUS23_08825 [Ectothiorhodospiraceae bacterium 2226]|nr:hypothetical protein HUS23_08825 [Ectothiorhodospiraceae bacterium 2226]
MDRGRVLGWVGVAISLWIVFRSALGSVESVTALLALAVASHLAVGSIVLFVIATGVIATVRSDLAAEDALYALYLPMYVMFAVIYVLLWVSVRAPELARRGDGPDIGGGDGGNGC